jgi:hypothetical protein
MQRNKLTRSASRTRDWRSIAEQARVEMDPEKLLNLVAEINSILDEQQSHTSGREPGENREPHENRPRKSQPN